MPELPDLTVFARNLRALLLGKEAACAQAFNRFKVNATDAALTDAIAGKSLDAIERAGKEIYFSFSGGAIIGVHLMLQGRFFADEAEVIAALPHKTASLCFADGTALAVTDPLRMAKVTLNPKKAKSPDVLSDGFTYDYFLGAAQRNEIMNVKAFLIDQKIMRGIGNAYADEILYAANISPENYLGRIPEKYLRALYDAIPAVLLDAIERITKIAPDIIGGEERSFLKVHNPKRAATDAGERIVKKQVAGKSTYFTEGQRRFVP